MAESLEEVPCSRCGGSYVGHWRLSCPKYQKPKTWKCECEIKQRGTDPCSDCGMPAPGYDFDGKRRTIP